MAKKKLEKPRREPTKQQISHWQREEKRRRLIFAIGVGIIALVLALVGIGWYISDYRPLHQTVIKVNDTEFNMDYYVETLKYYQQAYPSTTLFTFADIITGNIGQSELMRQGAAKLEYVITDKEVAKELKERELPKNQAYLDLVRTELLVNKLRDEYFEQQVPKSAQQVQVMAMFQESEKQALEVKARLENGEDFGALAGELSLDTLSKNGKGDFGWHPKGVFVSLFGGNANLEDYAFSAEVGVVSEPIKDASKYKKVGYWLLKVVEQEDDPQEAHVFAILLGSEEEATNVRSRLESGEDFAAISKELSQLGSPEAETGDLDWVKPGEWTEAFDAFVFSPEVKLNELSEPIRDEIAGTAGGYWLIKVNGKEANREIEANDRDILKALAFNDWVDSLNKDPANKIDDSYLTPEKKAWAVMRVEGS